MKELIKDLAYDKITLTQGLTRAKLLAFKIGNKTLKDWIKTELEGYNSAEDLPLYRKVPCTIKGTITDMFGREDTVPISFDTLGKEFGEMMGIHNVTQSIGLIEVNYSELKTEMGFVEFSPRQLQMLEDMTQVKKDGRRLIRAGREMSKLQLKNIMDQTKQKLIDTLLELDLEFPNLQNEFNVDKTTSEKIQNIITNNIYGNSNPLNIAAGNNVNQSDINNNVYQIDYSLLTKFGVEEKEIEDLKSIVNNNKNDKDSLKQQVMKWLGKVSASIAGRGLYDNIPAITEFVEKLI